MDHGSAEGDKGHYAVASSGAWGVGDGYPSCISLCCSVRCSVRCCGFGPSGLIYSRIQVCLQYNTTVDCLLRLPRFTSVQALCTAHVESYRLQYVHGQWLFRGSFTDMVCFMSMFQFVSQLSWRVSLITCRYMLVLGTKTTVQYNSSVQLAWYFRTVFHTPVACQLNFIIHTSTNAATRLVRP